MIYKITVKNWNQYNPKHKKHFKMVLIPINFTRDAKLQVLPLCVRWLFLDILMTCSDHASECVEYSSSQVQVLLKKGLSVPLALQSLEQLQLVTIEKSPLIERREEKEEKRRERTTTQVVKADVDNSKKLNAEIWETYRINYFNRYKIDPVRNASVNSKISQLGKRVGQDALEIVKFYLKHNDSFYLKNLHGIGFCLRDCESLYTQWQRGQAVTSTMVRSYEKEMTTQETLDYIDKHGI